MFPSPTLTKIARYIAAPICIALVAWAAWLQSIVLVLLAGATLTGVSFIRDIGLQAQRNRQLKLPCQIAQAQLKFGFMLVFQVIGTAVLIHLMWLQHIYSAIALTIAAMSCRLIWYWVHEDTGNRCFSFSQH